MSKDTTLQATEGRSIYDCIIYTGYINHDGYGYSGGKQIMRKLWEASWGVIPNNLELAHICDNRACINLGHIYLATHAENMADRYLHHKDKPRFDSKAWHHRYYAQNRESILRKAREKYARGR